MTRTSITVKAAELVAGDNLRLSYDTGVRVSHIKQADGWIYVYGDSNQQVIGRLRPNSTVRLHGRGVPT